MLRPGSRNLITDVDGILVGNEEDQRLRSGVSVVLCERPSVASVDVRGGAPGTRDTDLLDPSCRVDAIDAICLSGGSAFGLSSTDGVMRWLREHGRGVAIADVVVPIVPTAILFDLLNGGDKQWDWPPYREMAYAATGKASRDFTLGNAGAGLGAKAGNLKGGLGSASAVDPDDGPSGRRAGGRECAGLHDDGRHAAVLGLGAGAEQGVRRPAAAGARAVARGEPRSRRPQPRSGRCRAQRPARQHDHRRRRHQRPPRQGLGQSPGGDGAGRARTLDPPGAHAAGRRHRLRRGDRRPRPVCRSSDAWPNSAPWLRIAWRAPWRAASTMPLRWAPRAAGGTCSAADRLGYFRGGAFPWTHFPAVICSAPPARWRPCRFSAPKPVAQGPAKDRLVIGMSLEPPVLDPTKNAAAAIREVTTPSIFEALGRIDRTGAINPGLAESWSISEDGKEYVFKIRQGVKFHDGEPLDASVVKFSLDRLFAPDSTGPGEIALHRHRQGRGGRSLDGQGDPEVAQLLPALQPVAGRCGHHASQVGADQRQEPDRHRAVHVQGAQGRRFDHAGEVADLSRSGFDQDQHGDLQDREGSVGAGERASGR